MKKLILFLCLSVGLAAQTIPASPGVFSLSGTGGGSGGGVTQIIAGTNVTISPVGGTGAVTVNSSGGGTPGGSSGDLQYNNAGAFGGYTPGTGVVTWLQTPSSANLAAAVTGETGTGGLVFATSPTLVTPVLGVATATSINKVAFTAPATSATLTLIDGTTLTGPAASGTAATLAGTETLTNKRISARITTIVSSATPTVNTDNTDAVTITALAATITSMTTNLSGTPNNFDRLVYRIKDDGTGRPITWGASFASRVGTLPSTTVASKVVGAVFWWNSVTSTWDCMASGTEP